jgi:hypothetical protein
MGLFSQVGQAFDSASNKAQKMQKMEELQNQQQ